jgi:ABC-type transporter Mla MlaB component
MLRITIQSEDESRTLVLEGRLTRDVITEVLKTWTELACLAKPISVDLTSVSSVDAAGRRLLTDMNARGVILTGSGVMIRGLIDEIVA